MAGSPPSSTTSVTTNIPAWAEPYQQQIWQQGYDAIGNLTAEDTQSPYGTISPWNQAQQTATALRVLSGQVADCVVTLLPDSLLIRLCPLRNT